MPPSAQETIDLKRSEKRKLPDGRYTNKAGDRLIWVIEGRRSSLMTEAIRLRSAGFAEDELKTWLREIPIIEVSSAELDEIDREYPRKDPILKKETMK